MLKVRTRYLVYTWMKNYYLNDEQENIVNKRNNETDEVKSQLYSS